MASVLRRSSARTRAEDGGTAAADSGAAADDRRPRRAGRGRVAAARGAWAVGSAMTALARLVKLIVGIVVLVIVAAIVLRVLGANPSNAVVSDIHDAGKALVGPFNNVFSISGPKLAMAVNWGIAALVYLLVGTLIARLILRAAPAGVHPAQPVS